MNSLKILLLTAMVATIAQTYTTSREVVEATLHDAHSLMSQTSTAYIPGIGLGAFIALAQADYEQPGTAYVNLRGLTTALFLVPPFVTSACWYTAWMCSEAKNMPTAHNVALGLGINL